MMVMMMIFMMMMRIPTLVLHDSGMMMMLPICVAYLLGLLPEVVLEAGGEGASSVDGSTIISELYF